LSVVRSTALANGQRETDNTTQVDTVKQPLPIAKVLVANRGEIARRIFRTLRRMGIGSVAVYSDADTHAPHVGDADEAVRIGPAPSLESYLDIARVLAAARAVGADAVHPGYGFLAENAEFAARCADAGLSFIGPPVDAIRRMGSKVEARAIMTAAGVPVVPGVSGAGLDDAALKREAKRLGLPLLIKASAGGGGKGMRLVRDSAALADALAAARREAHRAFDDDTLLLERYFDAPRHIEVQIFGDAQGRVVHLFERECSIQRRFQKIIEEAPSLAVDGALRARIGAAAVAAGTAIGYTGAGTVEFILDRTGDFYFLEVNTRLQVEHPVTEAITGLDLVELQVRIAQGEPLPFAQRDVHIAGHAIEARLYAEDPAADFLPATGQVALWQPAPVPGVRYDSGVEAGSSVTVHYDPLLAKVVAHGATRAQAVQRLRQALGSLGVAGVTTNRDFLLAVLAHPAFAAGEIDTHFIERHLSADQRAARRDPSADRLHAIVAAIEGHERRRRQGGPLPASIPSGWRNNRWRAQDVTYRLGGGSIEVRYIARPAGCFDVDAENHTSQVTLISADEREIDVEIDSVRRRFAVAARGDTLFLHGPLGTAELIEVPRFASRWSDDTVGGCLAPMPGIVRQVLVAVGDRVEKGAVMVVLEAMKMEHPLIAHAPGMVKEVRVEVGQMVDPDYVMVVIEPEEDRHGHKGHQDS
jgi:acetyl-CoA carboxylase biotin carboxylase subunit